MKFKELPENVQLIATTTLADILKTGYPTKESAIESAGTVKAAFIELYSNGGVDAHVGDVVVGHRHPDIADSVDKVIAGFQPDELSVFHIVKMANEVNLTIRNALAPHRSDDRDTNSAARAILETALTALNGSTGLSGVRYGLR